MRNLLLPSLFFTSALAACGGTTVSGSGGQGPGGGGPNGGGTTTSGTTTSGTSDGGLEGDGGCIAPTEGAPCTTGQVACSEGDPCCIGYLWSCSDGFWQKLGVGCACQPTPTPFACGDKTCQGNEYCQDHPPGIPPPDDGGVLSHFYTCVPLPFSCGSFPSCGCVETSIPNGDPCSSVNVGVTCDDDGAGHITLHCMGI